MELRVDEARLEGSAGEYCRAAGVVTTAGAPAMAGSGQATAAAVNTVHSAVAAATAELDARLSAFGGKVHNSGDAYTSTDARGAGQVRAV